MTAVPGQRRGRDGEPLEPDDDEPDEHPRDCRGGWRGEDGQGRPRPCWTCRPHLRPAAIAATVHGRHRDARSDLHHEPAQETP